MPEIYAHTAHAYAEAVVAVLAEEFPSVTHGSSLGRMVLQDVAWQAQNPTRSFEVIVTYTREWRLHPEELDFGSDRWRVVLGCHKDHWTEADIRFSDFVNARLRAIRLEG